MFDFAKMAEARILEAIQKGHLKNLPGEGKPLDLEDPNPFEDPDERMANKLMKNLGLIPMEMDLKKEIESLRQKLSACQDSQVEFKLKKKLEEVTIRYNIVMEKRRRSR